VVPFFVHCHDKSTHGEYRTKRIILDILMERQEVAGEEVHRIACGVGQMREATGLSLSIGTLMLAHGELLTEEGGVYAPEVCLDPQRFIAYLSDKGIGAYEDLAMTWQIT